ncbi:MAG: HAD-IC family P-type ATPase [Patescibacteria group bacterium]|nr:HAD-IC family P-type ATPase [Patescibacteria group bacterium]
MQPYQNWHVHTIANVLKNLITSEDGLSSRAVKLRLKRYGRNELPQEKKLSKVLLFLRQFHSPLMYILLSAVAISFFLGHYSDSIFILFVLFINTVVGFWQENKANNSLAALKKMVKVRVRVLREGAEKEVDGEDLVVGDVIILNPGDKVPADARIIQSKELKMNEASLTGEWQVVEKKTGNLPTETIVSDRTNMLFMGTSVEFGEARAVIVATGIETEFGKIVDLVKKTEEPKTHLQKKIFHLSKLVGVVVLLCIVGISIEGLLLGKNLEEVLIATLALAVSAIPEGLLAAITVVLVLAMRRILKQKGVVKKLSAAEGLGSVTVVCTDKTGTLTEGNMQVSHILTSTKELLSKEIEVENIHDPNGVTSDMLALKIASLTNDAFIENPQDELNDWIVRGYYTDKALLMAGIKAGLDMEALEKKHPLIEKLNFSSHARFAASFRGKGKKKKLFVVGAPEELMNRSINLDTDGKQKNLGVQETAKLMSKLESLASKGLRVVACAYRDVENRGKETVSQMANDLTLVGFIALKDPVRKDVKKAISQIRGAGVRLSIITGDHRLTAKAVAEELGLEVKGDEILEGNEIEKMSNTDLMQKVGKIKIFARALPEHKLKIVEALHRNNEIVAMFGDGVNDAPALKASDIGVAVGSGTDVAKEVADVILLDDNFKTIVKAIEQGRVAFSNIRKVFIYLVADDFTEILLFVGAMAFGFPLPLLAAQILWINLIEDGFPDIALTTEQETKGVMSQPPRSPDEPIISSQIKKWMLSIFAINGLITFVFFYFSFNITADIDRTRTLVFTLMAFDSLAFAYSVRSLHESVFRKDIFSNKFLNWAVIFSFVLLLAAIYIPALQRFLGTTTIGFKEWGIIVLITVLEIEIIEIFKNIFLLDKHKKRKFLGKLTLYNGVN